MGDVEYSLCIHQIKATNRLKSHDVEAFKFVCRDLRTNSDDDKVLLHVVYRRFGDTAVSICANVKTRMKSAVGRCVQKMETAKTA